MYNALIAAVLAVHRSERLSNGDFLDRELAAPSDSPASAIAPPCYGLCCPCAL